MSCFPISSIIDMNKHIGKTNYIYLDDRFIAVFLCHIREICRYSVEAYSSPIKESIWCLIMNDILCLVRLESYKLWCARAAPSHEWAWSHLHRKCFRLIWAEFSPCACSPRLCSPTAIRHTVTAFIPAHDILLVFNAGLALFDGLDLSVTKGCWEEKC